jgi:hypothetical protein
MALESPSGTAMAASLSTVLGTLLIGVNNL